MEELGIEEKKQKNEKYGYTPKKENLVMKEFYQRQLGITDEDFEAFWEIAKQPLPIAFRVNPTQQNYQIVISKLSSSLYETENFKLKCIPWYPNSLVWEANSHKTELRKVPSVKAFHTFLLNANDCGLVTRQELVSMIPPLVLDIHPNQTVLDICAAPGSKTAQIIEIMQGEGLVVANDVDKNRAYMLIHQLHRSNTSCMVVVNHPAQNFPMIGEGNFKFDRVLCDVPCTGDGAIRKLPLKWKEWNVKEGYAIHGLQIDILIRAIELCKVGGLVCYSTCSLNPIENEAVVNEVYKRFQGTLEIQNLPEILEEKCPGLAFRRGLKTWKVFGNARKKEQYRFIEYKNIEELAGQNTAIKASAFPVDIPEEIINTVRIMPHDQNSGGFYIALFRKTAEKLISVQPHIEAPQPVEEATQPTEEASQPPSEASQPLVDASQPLSEAPQPVEEAKNPQKKQKWRDVIKGENFLPLSEDSEEYQNLLSCYGIETLPLSQLFTASSKKKNFYYVSSHITDFLALDSSKKLKIFNMGVVAFTKNREKESKSNCMHRPMQDALPFVSKFITKRKVICQNVSLLGRLVNEPYIEYDSIEEESVKEGLQDYGYYVLHFERINEDVVVLKISEWKVVPIIPVEHINSLKIRYDFQSS
ncbi:unnamed protein product [Blepharisma stoltei]|uniref:SAM-dependent MTase RsmB/NOP-type domain-containing protein n=1 Tax=Blepharisma stoltei TaxID=1481888 RepID=A0AAU9JEM9_9CILI|nr:unnamed protein product [Blepharisma stoltei]